MLIINETVDIIYESNTLLLRYFNAIPHYNTKLGGTELAKKIDACYEDAQVAFDEIELKYPRMVEIIRVFHELRSNLPMSPFLQPHLKNIPMNEVQAYLLKDLKESFENMNGVSYEDTITIFQLLDESSIDEKQKWTLLSVYENAELLYPQFIEIIELLKPYTEKLVASCNEEIKEFVEGWRALGDEASIVLNDSFGMKVKTDECILFPSVVAVNQGYFYYSDIFLGLVLNATFKSSRKMSFDMASEICKLLGDQTKSGIIQSLMKEDMYGKQIANKLGLTSATISYHIQELIESMIVTAEGKEGTNRLYYSLNKDTIVSALDYLSEQFSQ